jgi:D-alanyl-D-alanine carboxypeptidase
MTEWRRWRWFFILMFFLAGCQAQAAPSPTVTVTTEPPLPVTTATLTPAPTATASLAPTPVPTLFPLPTSDPVVGSCNQRHPADNDLLPVVTASFGLAPDYVPKDLVKLGDYVSGYVTLPDLLLRREAAEALGKMVKAMKQAGLAPTVLSAYRDYTEQYVTYRRWLAEDPGNASQVSALPGHSEHQLGTVVDFGSPELPGLTGDPKMQFSPLFTQTSEGRWLSEHADEYGFSMSNPPGAQPWTGLTYEPWHYRYVGTNLATYLQARGTFLTKYILQVRPGLPCMPGL